MAGPPSGVDLLPSMPPLTIIIPRFTSYEPVIVFPSTSMLISFVISSQNVESAREKLETATVFCRVHPPVQDHNRPAPVSFNSGLVVFVALA